jgi:MFS family permease
MRSRAHPLTGLPAFLLVWLSQFASVLATQMTQFALTLWIYEGTGRVTALALQEVFFITPFLLMTPLAGALVDRHNRKLMMMVSDLGAGAATLGLLLLQAADRLEVWHLYVAAVVAGTCNCFQWPAYSASLTLMVPKEHYGRANGLMALVETGPGVLAPMLAGALLAGIGLTGIMLIDAVTFVLAIGALLVVVVPQPAPVITESGGLRREAAFGFRYILRQPSLLGLQLVFLAGNLFSGLGYTVLAPMILARTGNDEAQFAAVLSVGALGGIAGAILMGVWGGFQRRVRGVVLGWLLRGLLGMVSLGLGRGLAWWMPAKFLAEFCSPVMDASNQSIWQAKVPPGLQGRVFSARMLIAWSTFPVAPLIAGALADRVLEPGMRQGGGLAPIFGWLVGTGPGAGMALLLVLAGLGATAAGAVGYLSPAVRQAEDRLADPVVTASDAVPLTSSD